MEDYWDPEWSKIEEYFQEMKELGANGVRIHPQLGKFIREPDKPSEAVLNQVTPMLAWLEFLEKKADAIKQQQRK